MPFHFAVIFARANTVFNLCTLTTNLIEVHEFTPLIHYHGCLPNFLGSQMFFPLQNFQYDMNFESQSSVRGNRESQDTLSCEQDCFNLYINAVDEAILP